MSPSRPRVLVRSTNWIGDVVMSLPALREVRRLHPDAHLAVVARDWVADLYREQGLVDEIVSFPSGRSSLRLIGRLRDFDRAVLFQNAFEAALLASLAGIPDRVGYATQGRGFLLTRKARPRTPGRRLHQVFYYLDLLHLTGLSDIDYLNRSEFRPDIRLRATRAGLGRARALLAEAGAPADGQLMGLNPGATFGPAKRWLTDRYAALADRLIRETGATVLIFGSAAERPIAEAIQGSMKARAIILSGRTSLETLVALISSCSLFITNDSGPMHLAAALEVPQVALFGSTDEIATGPFDSRAEVIHKHVDCSPCLRRTCPIDLRCFTRIGVDEVYEAARRRLDEARQD
ncbi:MAG: lipopolysaccharide heptosyltransferase II [Acidobacteriota bacterium]